MNLKDECVHRIGHNKDSHGRATEIEQYIKQTVEWYIKKINFNKNDVFYDIGSDYGFALSVARQYGFKLTAGIEPFPTELTRENLTILPVTLEELNSMPKLTNKKMHVFINHVFEHLENPLQSLKVFLSKYDVETILISTPDARGQDSDWVCGGGHYWTFTPDYFSNILPNLIGYDLIDQKCVTFRKGWGEIWNVYKKR